MSSKESDSGARLARAGMCLPWLVAVAFVVSAGHAAAEESATRVEADGVLRVPALQFSPSQFWSPQFKKAYAERVSAAAVSGAAPKPPALDAPKSAWDEFDAGFDRGLAGMLASHRQHYAVDVVDTRIAGVRVGIVTPKSGVAPANAHRVLINLHGGGFFAGRGIAAGLVDAIPVAALGRFKVITVDYRMVPYAQYPAGSEDVAAVYGELLKQYPPQAIGIFGGSAGGTLTAQSVAWFQAKGLPRPGAVGIFWQAPPAVPPAEAPSGDSIMWGGAGLLSPGVTSLPAAMGLAWSTVKHYMDSADRGDWKAYPASSDAVLAKFPPTLFLSGTRAYDMSAVINAHARLLRLGVDSSLYIVEGGWHGVSALGEQTPESHDVNVYIAKWFDSRLTSPAPSRHRPECRCP